MKLIMDESGVAALQVEVDRKVTRPLTEAIARDMQRYVPVLTGDLLRTIRTRYPRAGLGQIWFGDVAGGINGRVVDYHLYVENGTSRMAAQPYARPAAYQRRTVL